MWEAQTSVCPLIVSLTKASISSSVTGPSCSTRSSWTASATSCWWATRRIRSRQPLTRVLCLSSHSDPVMVEAMLEAGASGYQLKDHAVDELVRAIEVVMANETYLSPRVAGGVVQAMLSGSGSAAASKSTSWPSSTSTPSPG